MAKINMTDYKEKKRTWQYKRILEILDDYWLTEPDEEYVSVNMYFRKANGEEQCKTIVWKKPDENPKRGYTKEDLYIKTAAELNSISKLMNNGGE